MITIGNTIDDHHAVGMCVYCASVHQARGDKPLVVPPLLVSFPHGQPPESILQSIDFQGMATESKPGQKRRRVCLSGESDYVKYQCAQPTVSRKTLGDYMVGVYNKETEEVVLYPAHAILSMEQKVKVRVGDQGETCTGRSI